METLEILKARFDSALSMTNNELKYPFLYHYNKDVPGDAPFYYTDENNVYKSMIEETYDY